MKRMLFLALFMACGCCRGETNSIPCELFRSTRTELRTLSLENHQSQPITSTADILTIDVPRVVKTDFDIGRGLDQTRMSAETAANSYVGGLDPQLYHHLDRNGYLTRPSPPSSNLLVRVTDEVFTPEPILLGKTSTFSCSILTAIKRKNPLCLLNTLPFLQLSW
jgi:hypothetical protein